MNNMTTREKVLLGILGIMCLVLAYYYLVYTPMKNQTAQYKEEYAVIDDTLIVVEAKAAKLAKMKAELEEIKAGSTGEIKELPKYDNRQNLMSQLSTILAKANNYSIRFGSITGDGTTICRQVTLDYTCGDYPAAKVILKEIYDGQYPCSIGNIHLSNEGATVSMHITYYEYGNLEQ